MNIHEHCDYLRDIAEEYKERASKMEDIDSLKNELLFKAEASILASICIKAGDNRRITLENLVKKLKNDLLVDGEEYRDQIVKGNQTLAGFEYGKLRVTAEILDFLHES